MKTDDNYIHYEKNKRKFIRVGIRPLNSIIRNEQGEYVAIKESNKAATTSIMIHDISLGGACITLYQELKKEALIDLELPKIKNLDSEVLNCKVTHSAFVDADPMLSISSSTGSSIDKENQDDQYKDKSYYQVGLKFNNQNFDYLKKFIELAQIKSI